MEASFIQGVRSLIYLFSLCHSPLPPLPVLKFEFSLNPHSELAQRAPVPHITHLSCWVWLGGGGTGQPGDLAEHLSDAGEWPPPPAPGVDLSKPLDLPRRLHPP